MFLVDWLYGVLAAMGLFQKSAKIIFLGLDNAGKTTLLSLLKNDQIVAAQPTAHPVHKTLTVGAIAFSAYDMGGHASARRLWLEYCQEIDAIVFVVDTSDRERLAEANRELTAVLDQVTSVPVLVLGNKIDIPRGITKSDLRYELAIARVGARRNIDVFMCSLVKRQGYEEGFRWLAQYL